MADRTFSILSCPLHSLLNHVLSFQFCFVYVPNNYHMAKEEKGEKV